MKLFISIGLEVTKVHRIFRFKQDYIFKSFIEKIIELRQRSKSDFEKNLFKLLSNSIYGKTLFNARKNSNQIKLINSRDRFEKVVGNPLLKSCYPIDDDLLIMNFDAPKIKFNTPLYLGWFVLSHSKFFMYNFFYNVLKKTYDKDVSLLYMDTDSFLINMQNRNFLDEIQKEPLANWMDTSNFPEKHPLYTTKGKGKLGLFKSETAEIPIKEIIALQAKCYSVLLDNESIKSTAKGINTAKQMELKHDLYKKVYNSEILTYKVTTSNIVSHKMTLYTINMEKCALSKIDRKRYFIDKRNSYAFGHPNIAFKLPLIEPDTKPKKRKCSVSTDAVENLQFNFNSKKLKIVEGFTFSL